MRNPLLPLILLAIWGYAARAADPAVRPISQAKSIMAIYTEEWGLIGQKGDPPLILSIWSDGYVVWSKDRLRGGAPYLAGQIDPEIVSKLLARLEHDGLFAEKDLRHERFGPDSQFTTMLIKSGKRELRMSSWHELFEAEGKAVVEDGGVSGLNGRRRLAVLRKEPIDSLYYRFVWSETRGRMMDLIPNPGNPIKGKVVLRHGERTWHADPE